MIETQSTPGILELIMYQKVKNNMTIIKREGPNYGFAPIVLAYLNRQSDTG